MTTLEFTGRNMKTRSVDTMLIKASNVYQLAVKASKAVVDYYVKEWRIVTKKWEAGGNCLNADAYLHEYVDEMLGYLKLKT